ncbi:esterase/lipase family protein [Streptomyces hydrogenans]|uniref:esterase/lipase family protein n=1 Tax=Streptomyces hydrogenans TaxID=1873719 RepID=UPI00278BFE51|nr:thioesterase domain-containing protein [Streptomyces hydrogenans]
MSITEEQAAEAFTSGPPIILAPGPRTTDRTPPQPNDVWELPYGTAWIYHGEGNDQLTRPVLIADGFSAGPSDLALTWELLEHGQFPLLSEIRRRGRDVVLIGYHERSASILKNAEAVMAAVIEAISRRAGDHPLTVGGFSMGGLVTRYALAKLETDGIEHQAQLYYSWDSPHTGAWIPIALQAFAHYIKKLNPGFSDQINSPAAQELLCQHIANWDDKPATSDKRQAFLRALEEVGDWPRARQTRLIALANGPETGEGNGIAPGADALTGKGATVLGTKLRTQSEGESQVVANLRVLTTPNREVRTQGLPDIDGAPGGTLPGFGILADKLNALPALLGFGVANPVREHCFVPAVSAVALREPATHDDLYTPITDEELEETHFHAVKFASQSETHTLVTEELSAWFLDQLP